MLSQSKHLNYLDLIEKKNNNQQITCLTCYDSTMASIFNLTKGLDLVLVGDSVGNVILGYNSTLKVTVDHMITFSKAVSSCLKHSMLVVDLPFFSYQQSTSHAIENAKKLIQIGNAHALKIEGASQLALSTIKTLTESGIPMIGHLGVTPQTILAMGGYTMQGNNHHQHQMLVEDSKKLLDHGICLLVLEMVNPNLAKKIAESLPIPVIGIGSGHQLDGQILVLQDILGMTQPFIPKFAKQYAQLDKIIINAVNDYITDVQNKTFKPNN